MTSSASDRNQAIIEEFRGHAGVVGGPFAGATLLLLHTHGAKTGAARVNPLMYQALNGGWAVFASRGGAPTNPDWYHNLVAHPDASIEVGTETIDVTARVASGDERDRIWTAQKQARPQFAEYEAKTARQIPVIVLQRR